MTLQSERISNGLCPRCGDVAAPYRLCERHRSTESLRRGLNRLHKAGAIKKTTDGKRDLWSDPDMNAIERIGWRDYAPRKPRLAGVPVNVATEAGAILRELGRPETERELVEAYGKLRANKARTSIGADLARIVAADQKRATKMAKRAAVHRTVRTP